MIHILVAGFALGYLIGDAISPKPVSQVKEARRTRIDWYPVPRRINDIVYLDFGRITPTQVSVYLDDMKH